MLTIFLLNAQLDNLITLKLHFKQIMELNMLLDYVASSILYHLTEIRSVTTMFSADLYKATFNVIDCGITSFKLSNIAITATCDPD